MLQTTHHIPYIFHVNTITPDVCKSPVRIWNENASVDGDIEICISLSCWWPCIFKYIGDQYNKLDLTVVLYWLSTTLGLISFLLPGWLLNAFS